MSFIVSLLPLATQAGTYAPVLSNATVDSTHPPSYYSGGTFTVNGSTSAYIYSNGTYGGARLTLFQASSLQCGGAITITWNWVPANANDLPPQNVIIGQTSSVSAVDGNGTGSAVCANGLGGTFVPLNAAHPNWGGSVQSTKYSIIPGGWTVTAPPCTPTASASDANPFSTNMVSVSYSATITPIVINPTGTTPDSTGALNILIGQGCTAYIQAGTPLGNAVTFSNFNWSLGPVFDQFLTAPAPDQSWGHVTYLTDSAYHSPAPHFHYYLDSGDSTVAVTCSATASVNGISIGTVQAERDVKVWAPDYMFKNTSGEVSVDSRSANGGPISLQLYAGGPVDNTFTGHWDPPGMQNGGRVSTPNLFRLSPTGTTGTGSWEFGQLITPGRWLYNYDDSGNSVMTDILWNGLDWNGQTVLDNAWPYSATSVGSPAPPWPADSVDQSPLPNTPTYWMEDSPGNGLTDDIYRERVDESFNDYLMYLPPDKGYDAQWVPLHLFQWKWQADVTELSSWALAWAPHPPGYTSDISSARCDTHPQWSGNLTNGH